MEHKLTKEQKHSLYTHTELNVHTYMQYDQSWAEIALKIRREGNHAPVNFFFDLGYFQVGVLFQSVGWWGTQKICNFQAGMLFVFKTKNRGVGDIWYCVLPIRGGGGGGNDIPVPRDFRPCDQAQMKHKRQHKNKTCHPVEHSATH